MILFLKGTLRGVLLFAGKRRGWDETPGVRFSDSESERLLAVCGISKADAPRVLALDAELAALQDARMLFWRTECVRLGISVRADGPFAK